MAKISGEVITIDFDVSASQPSSETSFSLIVFLPGIVYFMVAESPFSIKPSSRFQLRSYDPEIILDASIN